MKQSAVQAFKSITNRIHPQLALSEKESQRLINALTSSFTHQLDQEFPSSAQRPRRPSLDGPNREPTAVKSSSSSSADTHLASILTNPLFGRPPTHPTSSNATLSQLKARTKHPVQIFEDAVARGQATIDIARLCLNAFRSSLKEVPQADQVAHLRQFAAGIRALRWLWSSGKIQAYAFAEDRHFLDLIVYFLRREGNEAAVWDLILSTQSANLAKETIPTSKDTRRRKAYILCSLIKAHLDSGAVSEAISAFLRTADVLRAQNIPQYISLPIAGAFLSKHLTQNDYTKHNHTAFVSLYDRFVESCPLWVKGPSDRALYRVANLKLHHPTTPSARDALFFIRHLKHTSAHPFLSPTTDSQKADVFKFFFDTVRTLQKQGTHEDAAWVMDFMQHAFPEHFQEQNLSAEKPAASQAVAEHNAGRQEKSASVIDGWRVPALG